MNVPSHVEVLLVEDNPADAVMIKEAIRETKFRCRLCVVGSGEEALDYLHGRGSYKKAGHPDLVLLDLNLPGKNGMEVLAEVKADVNLKRTPVVVLTSSGAREDISAAYERGANAYMQKRLDLQDIYTMMSDLQKYWFKWTILPSH